MPQFGRGQTSSEWSYGGSDSGSFGYHENGETIDSECPPGEVMEGGKCQG